MGSLLDGATIAGMTSIEMIVEAELAPGTSIASSPYTLTVADVIFDTLQTDANDWTKDGDGYNFRTETTAEMTPTAPAQGVSPDFTRYRFEVWFTPATGEKWMQVFFLDAIEARGPT